LPRKYANRGHYQYLTGLAFKLLKQEISENDIITELWLALQSADQSMEINAPDEHNSTRKKFAGLVSHPKGQYRFINSSAKRFSVPFGVLSELTNLSSVLHWQVLPLL